MSTVRLELTSEEAAKLRQLVDGCLADLRGEIRHTDNRAFRQMLKQDEAFLRSLLARLEAKELKAA